MECSTDVTTTKVSDSFLKEMTQGKMDLSKTSPIVFTVYYHTFDITTVSFHGKVITTAGCVALCFYNQFKKRDHNIFSIYRFKKTIAFECAYHPSTSFVFVSDWVCSNYWVNKYLNFVSFTIFTHSRANYDLCIV